MEEEKAKKKKTFYGHEFNGSNFNSYSKCNSSMILQDDSNSKPFVKNIDLITGRSENDATIADSNTMTSNLTELNRKKICSETRCGNLNSQILYDSIDFNINGAVSTTALSLGNLDEKEEVSSSQESVTFKKELNCDSNSNLDVTKHDDCSNGVNCVDKDHNVYLPNDLNTREEDCCEYLDQCVDISSLLSCDLNVLTDDVKDSQAYSEDQFEFTKDHILQSFGIGKQKLLRFKCSYCKFSSNFKASLSRHVEDIHLKLKQFVCPDCNYSTNRKHNLKTHVDGLHLNIKKLKCLECDYATNFKCDLQRHMKSVHLVVPKLQCSQCDYTTHDKSSLKNHVECVHLKDRKFQCLDIGCNYSSSHKNLLMNHIESVHLNIKKFTCSECSYTTNVKGNLKIHVDRVHLKIMPFSCPHCEYKASRRCLLNNHVKNHMD